MADPAPRLTRLLQLYPRRATVPWDVVEEHAVLLFPKAYGPFERLVARLVDGPRYVRVALDDLGTAVWLAADGTRTGSEVATDLKARFGERAEPAEARAATFLEHLRRRGLIEYYERANPATDPARGLTRERGFTLAECPECGARVHVHMDDARKRFLCPRCNRVRRPRAPDGA